MLRSDWAWRRMPWRSSRYADAWGVGRLGMAVSAARWSRGTGLGAVTRLEAGASVPSRARRPRPSQPPREPTAGVAPARRARVALRGRGVDAEGRRALGDEPAERVGGVPAPGRGPLALVVVPELLEGHPQLGLVRVRLPRHRRADGLQPLPHLLDQHGDGLPGEVSLQPPHLLGPPAQGGARLLRRGGVAAPLGPSGLLFLPVARLLPAPHRLPPARPVPQPR